MHVCGSVRGRQYSQSCKAVLPLCQDEIRIRVNSGSVEGRTKISSENVKEHIYGSQVTVDTLKWKIKEIARVGK